MYNKNSFFSILVSAAIITSFFSCGNNPNYQNVSLKTDIDSASYYLGYNYGVNFPHWNFEDVNLKAFARGMQEAIRGGKNVDEDKMADIQMFLSEFSSKLESRAYEQNNKDGQDFLRANERRQGVVTLPSGLQYRIIREGTGARPTRDDIVELLYHGSLIDGRIFDSSKMRGDTVSFPVSGVVQGFSEALTLMSEGSIWEVYIPSELGYGLYPPPGSEIDPFSVLIFEIDLVRILKLDIVYD